MQIVSLCRFDLAFIEFESMNDALNMWCGSDGKTAVQI